VNNEKIENIDIFSLFHTFFSFLIL